MAGKNVWAQRSYRIAIRCQFLNPTEHDLDLDLHDLDLDLVALLIELFAVAALLLAVGPRRNARLDTVLLQGGDQPIGVIPTVGYQMLGSRETGEQVSRAGIIARLSGGQQQTHPHAVTYCVELRIQPAFRATNTVESLSFKQAGCGSVDLQMSGIDHEVLGRSVLLC